MSTQQPIIAEEAKGEVPVADLQSSTSQEAVNGQEPTAQETGATESGPKYLHTHLPSEPQPDIAPAPDPAAQEEGKSQAEEGT